ncbi:BQ5605_C006g04016 [Microbotryum silenes-dioicae]|uniref:BQ5605_C006g04016 protein n=1 Tax=Microbotryum silenes-dioicae TaxID=796604 RepID=A0A2X0M5Q0_9BASI|nr:BQ5605_C006g04016 [Microbotryum silenes-dioicae]
MVVTAWIGKKARSFYWIVFCRLPTAQQPALETQPRRDIRRCRGDDPSPHTGAAVPAEKCEPPRSSRTTVIESNQVLPPQSELCREASRLAHATQSFSTESPPPGLRTGFQYNQASFPLSLAVQDAYSPHVEATSYGTDAQPYSNKRGTHLEPRGARCMRWLGTHFYTQEHLPFSQRLPPILAPMFEDFLDSGSENFGFGSAPSSEFFNTETLREQTAGDLIYELVSFVLNNSYLGFQGKLFHQVSGTAMGTALAPTYANLFVGALEREARLLETPNLIFYGRYIDDVIAIVKGPRSNVDICISALAQLHPSLVFDAEVSSNGLPFLDAFISKNPDPKNSSRWSLSTRVYQKDFNSYQYIPWSSEHPESVKSAFVKGELIRYIRLSSSRDEYITQMTRFYLRLRARGYPTRWLRKAFKVVQYSDVCPVALERKQIENMGETPLIFHSDYNPVWNQVNAGLILTKTVEDWNPDLRTKLTGTKSRRIINARSRTRNLGEIVSWRKPREVLGARKLFN